MESIITNNIKIIKKDVKNITLKVKPNGEVELSVPLNANNSDVLYVLKKRKKWIQNKITFFKTANNINIKEYVSGESFRYLGKSYRLKIIESSEEKVKLLRGYIQIYVKNKHNTKRKEKLLNEWYIQRAKNYFNKTIQEYLKIVKKDVKNVRIRKMKTRWGSCNTAKSYINLNSELIKKPKECIEYVIFHELAHLTHPNHSKKFYNYLDTYMPDWRKRKEKLENYN